MDEEQLRSITDDIPALISIMTSAGELESCNQSALEYFGMGLEDLRGWRGNDSVHVDDRAHVVAAWSRAVQREQPYDIEHRMRRADGVYRWFRVRGQPMRGTDGRVTRWCVLSTDIDEHKRLTLLSEGEKQLLERIARGEPLVPVLEALCRLSDSAVDGCCSGVLAFDVANRRVQHAVAPSLPAACTTALEGLTASEAQGQAIQALARAQGLTVCCSAPVLSFSGQPVGTFTLFQRNGEGKTTPLHEALIGQFTHVASLAIQRTRNEEALRRNEAMLTAAEQVSLTGCFSRDLLSGEHWWSAQTYRIFGIDPGLVPTFEVMRERIHPEDLEGFESMAACGRRGEAFSVELRLQMPDRTVKHLHLVADVMSETNRRMFVGAVRDISERRRSEEALERARSELAHVARVGSLGVLTASIAHEVNQPLSGIMTNASACLLMLAADPPNIEGASETARRTIRDGNRAFAVIAKLRALFMKKAVSMEPVDLNAAAQEVMALLRSELQRHRVVLRTQLAEDLPYVFGDRVQLQQVVLNLVVNAIDALREVEDRPRQLTVSTALRGEQVIFTLRDSGPGLAPDVAERVFDAFYTTKSAGMGIGLSVSRAIIEGHHGTITAIANDGPGTSFAFALPSGPNTKV